MNFPTAPASKAQRRLYALPALALAASAVLLAGCGGSSSAYPPTATPTPTPTPTPPTLIVTSATSQAAGSADGATITVPAGSAPVGTTFNITSPSSIDIPASTDTIGTVFGTPVQLTSSAANFAGFAGPVTITISYYPGNVALGTGQTPQNALRIAVAQGSGNTLAWNLALENETVDTTNDTVTADLPSFANTGVYGVVQIMPPTLPSPSLHGVK